METISLTECPSCHHPPIQHKEDGYGGATCVVCLFISTNYPRNPPLSVCTAKFQFRLSLAEREQAKAADKGAYPQKKLCALCDCYWMAHEGFLCPSGDSTFVPVIEGSQPFLITH